MVVREREGVETSFADVGYEDWPEAGEAGSAGAADAGVHDSGGALRQQLRR